MDQYINATRLMTSIDTALARPLSRGNAKSTQDLVSRVTLGVVKQMVQEELKTGDFKPVVHAHWIKRYEDWDDNKYYECSNCHMVFIGTENFCCDCGATMDKPVEN